MKKLEDLGYELVSELRYNDSIKNVIRQNIIYMNIWKNENNYYFDIRIYGSKLIHEYLFFKVNYYDIVNYFAESIPLGHLFNNSSELYSVNRHIQSPRNYIVMNPVSINDEICLVATDHFFKRSLLCEQALVNIDKLFPDNITIRLFS